MRFILPALLATVSFTVQAQSTQVNEVKAAFDKLSMPVTQGITAAQAGTERLKTSQVDSFRAGAYLPISKQNYSYSNGLNSEILFQEYVNSNFSDIQKNFITYDAKGNAITIDFQVKDGGTYKTARLISNTFDSKGNLTLQTTEEDLLLTGTLVPSSQVSQTYNANNTVNVMIFSDWSDSASAFIPANRQTYTYDARGNNITTILETYSDVTKTYTLQATFNNEYNAQNLLVRDSAIFSFGPGVEFVIDKDLYTYDAQSRLETNVNYGFGGGFFGDPPIESRFTYSYNGSDTLAASQVTANYDVVSMTYSDTLKTENTYTDEDNVLQNEYFTSSNGGAAYTEIWRQVNTYESTVGVRDISNTSIEVYPNPATDVLYLGTKGAIVSSIVIVDMNGKVVLSEVNPSDNVVSINTLNSGLYLVRVAFATGETKLAKFSK